MATVVADFNEGVQGLVTATMACQETPIRQLIRGHNGSFVFGNGEQFDEFPVHSRTPASHPRQQTQAGSHPNRAGCQHDLRPLQKLVGRHRGQRSANVQQPRRLRGGGIVYRDLGAQSYRNGKVYHFDSDTLTVHEGGSDWAKKWEEKSHRREKPNHIAGWKAGDLGSVLEEPDYMKLAGPWVNGKDPAST